MYVIDQIHIRKAGGGTFNIGTPILHWQGEEAITAALREKRDITSKIKTYLRIYVYMHLIEIHIH